MRIPRQLTFPVGVLLLLIFEIAVPSSIHSVAARAASTSGLRTALYARQSASEADIGEADELQLAARVAALRTRPSEYSNDAVADLVPHLPGWGAVEDFNMFAGYITVDDAAGRALFYILAEASGEDHQGPQSSTATHRSSASEKPLVLWLNGGPGCSSIGGGFMTELGPFFPLPGGKMLQSNPHSWNQFAHVLFLESPAFVGFSYSNTTSDAIVGDDRTTTDSRVFMLRFLERFPRFRNTPFFVSGESYAGHYVPTLALAIVEGNNAAAATGDPKINLQGFLVGNPWTDAAIDNMGAIDYWWSHALVSDQTAQGVRANCNFSRIGPLDPHPFHPEAETRDELCDDFCNKAFDELGSINIYEIYADLCDEPLGLRRQAENLGWALGRGYAEDDGISGRTGSSATDSPTARASLAAAAASALGKRNGAGTTSRRLQQKQQGQLPGRRTQPVSAMSYKHARLSYAGDGSNTDYDPCIDDEAETYLNLPEVQRALHANQTVKLPWRWTDCTRSIMYSREDLLSSMLPKYDRLLQTNLRILVYSGDVDGIVPVVGTRRWVASLRLKEKDAWRPWFSGTQVGGYVVEYDGLTFATVRGAGHMVPYVQPARAAYMAKSFLTGAAL